MKQAEEESPFLIMNLNLLLSTLSSDQQPLDHMRTDWVKHGVLHACFPLVTPKPFLKHLKNILHEYMEENANYFLM